MISRKWIGVRGVIIGALMALVAPTQAQTRPVPPPLPAETSDVAVLPSPGPHRVIVTGGLMFEAANVIDADDEAGIPSQTGRYAGDR